MARQAQTTARSRAEPSITRGIRVVDFEKKLQSAGKKFEIHRYPGQHAFMNSDRKEVHDAGAANQAWARCVAFFRKHLA